MVSLFGDETPGGADPFGEGGEDCSNPFGRTLLLIFRFLMPGLGITPDWVEAVETALDLCMLLPFSVTTEGGIWKPALAWFGFWFPCCCCCCRFGCRFCCGFCCIGSAVFCCCIGCTMPPPCSANMVPCCAARLLLTAIPGLGSEAMPNFEPMSSRAPGIFRFGFGIKLLCIGVFRPYFGWSTAFPWAPVL